MQEGNHAEIDALGRKLSLEIDCAVRWPERTKDVFVCGCGIAFIVLRLKGSSDWSWVKKLHSQGGK